MTKDYGGVLNELVAGTWRHPVSGETTTIDIRAVIIRDTLEGKAGSLIAPLHNGEKLAVVSDAFTHTVLGRRVIAELRSEGLAAAEIIWEDPKSTEEGVKELRHLTRHCDGLIAVGSGTICDSVKYAAFLDKKQYSIFPTSPQNAYTTPTASISFGGFKKSLSCQPARGVFFDLAVVSKCPIRLTRSAFADVICRTTAQVDWLLSHLLLDTPYRRLPYVLLTYDEGALLENASNLVEGDIEAFGRLIRICALMGLGTNFAGTTHSGSMGEHMISHYIDMFAGDAHPGSLHGEQAGLASMTMSRLQNLIVNRKKPPRLGPTEIDKMQMIARWGQKVGTNCFGQFKRKALDHQKAEHLNDYLAENWGKISGQLREVMLPFETMWSVMEKVGAPQTAQTLGLARPFYREAVRYARQIRDRFTMLDMADDAGLLEEYIVGHE